MPRPRAWGDTRMSASLANGVGQQFDLLGSLTAADTITSARIIGHYTVAPTGAVAAIAHESLIDIGIGVVSAEAFNAGVVPDPNIDGDVPDRGWLYRDTLYLMFNNLSGTVEDYLYPSLRFDVRAARRVDRGKLFLVVHRTTIAGTDHACRITGLTRVLCLT